MPDIPDPPAPLLIFTLPMPKTSSGHKEHEILGREDFYHVSSPACRQPHSTKPLAASHTSKFGTRESCSHSIARRNLD